MKKVPTLPTNTNAKILEFYKRSYFIQPLADFSDFSSWPLHYVVFLRSRMQNYEQADPTRHISHSRMDLSRIRA